MLKVVVVVVSHIQRIDCQPEKSITLAENKRFRSVSDGNYDFYGVPEHVDRRPSPSVAENMSIAENMNLGWRVCGLLVEEPVCVVIIG